MRHCILLGRLSNGRESDRGVLVHAVILKACKRPKCPFNDFGRKVIPNDSYSAWIALCGTKPGKRSVGWSNTDQAVSCARCLLKLTKIVMP